MTAGSDDEHRLGWLEALHEAVVADQDLAFTPDAETSAAENVDAFRDCLRQLEQARRAGQGNAQLPPNDASRLDQGTRRRIGKFEILRTLGGGGQGIVFLALDTDLRRQVALKVPKPDALVSPDARRRFLREAHAAAGLAHPNIVTVHEIGEVFPACYLISDYCPGGSLQEYLSRQPAAIMPRAAAQIVAELAAGVHYAHLHGVLHRDIKPSNVFLVKRHVEVAAGTNPDPLLSYSPKLGDFGLARLAENDGELMATGTMLGTPAYMAPEQAGGRMNEVCAATDVYGLGTVLYELLAGRPTFRGVTDADTLRQVLFVEPEALRRLDSRVPRDLDAVCLRALEKDPRRRYSSAAALADDLNRYLKGTPTLVRPLTPVGKLWRAAHRRPAVATLATLLSIVVVIASALFVTSAIEQRRLNGQLVEQRLAAEKHARAATDLAYAADMQLADMAWVKSDITGLESILQRYERQQGQYDPRGVEWQYQSARLHDGSRILASDNGPGGCVQFSRDGSLLATGSHDGKIRVWEMPSGNLKWTIAEPPLVEINAFAFSADGKTLAAASNASRVLLCDLTTGKVDRALLGGHVEWVSDVDFSPDGQRLCSVSGDGMIAIWDWKAGQRLQRFRGHTKELRSARYTRDGEHLITGAQEGMVQIWNLPSETAVASIDEPELKPGRHAVWPRDIALSAEGTRLAVCWGIVGTRIYDITDVGNPVQLESLPQETGNQVHFLPDGQLVAGSSTIQIWSLGKTQTERTLRGHRDKIVSLSGTADGRTLATASKDGSVRVWSADLPNRGRALTVLEGICHKLMLSPRASQLLLQLTEPRRIALLNTKSGELVTDFPEVREPSCAAFVADGRTLALAAGSTITFYDRANEGVMWRWTRPTRSTTGDEIQELWSTQNRLIAKAGHEIWAVDLDSRRMAWHHNLGVSVREVVASPGDEIIYVGDQIGRIHFFGAIDGTELPGRRGQDSPVRALSVSGDRRFLVAGFENREIRLWDLAGGSVARHFATQEAYLNAAKFTSDGKTVVANYGPYVGFWHVASGQRLLNTGPWHDGRIYWDLSTDDDSLYLAVVNDGQTSICEVRLGGWKPQSTAAQTDPALPD